MSICKLIHLVITSLFHEARRGCSSTFRTPSGYATVAYGLRLLSKPEKKYCITRRELLAFVQQYHLYLARCKFTHSSHKPWLPHLVEEIQIVRRPASWVARGIAGAGLWDSTSWIKAEFEYNMLCMLYMPRLCSQVIIWVWIQSLGY